ncbi:hypothetical protein M378DRAFT_538752 [Amanita muscaria Koide BX008]|uniref:Uncharacterized protein n=1 Tax=Amanita muscaria (strain Koide BX008) TaxID=946122 RepID=A0A0C2SQ12_AMAMK|nr:hypothetical protein M378DRAFT_538752 [Amanita muscaria Koide BX008]
MQFYGKSSYDMICEVGFRSHCLQGLSHGSLVRRIMAKLPCVVCSDEYDLSAFHELIDPFRPRFRSCSGPMNRTSIYGSTCLAVSPPGCYCHLPNTTKRISNTACLPYHAYMDRPGIRKNCSRVLGWNSIKAPFFWNCDTHLEDRQTGTEVECLRLKV